MKFSRILCTSDLGILFYIFPLLPCFQAEDSYLCMKGDISNNYLSLPQTPFTLLCLFPSSLSLFPPSLSPLPAHLLLF